MLNAANEVAVAASSAGAIAFPAIAATNAAVLDAHLGARPRTRCAISPTVLEADGWARAQADARLGWSGGGRA